mmetsp:Transcript_21879/g.36937  ORF Transcript_21879/g.36937 Transcript_21879/m.36937 type:complete len:530 (+) Transcript_21879:2-1591(+)|eukprot:CAMPEP_0174975474 /NCGR_PEP_ID=MMETSP0004_2-20121128/12465_1 /TAXON_ID=420556 /ORGANISM="Ochromonas sp., Strain CCMP1393" /LENGTH=529 /DNA_ID=CAMNT_0016226333 /DNA_START=13 /DNA_END=1602 /DNA_ORIENTATION=+
MSIDEPYSVAPALPRELELKNHRIQISFDPRADYGPELKVDHVSKDFCETFGFDSNSFPMALSKILFPGANDIETLRKLELSLLNGTATGNYINFRHFNGTPMSYYVTLSPYTEKRRRGREAWAWRYATKQQDCGQGPKRGLMVLRGACLIGNAMLGNPQGCLLSLSAVSVQQRQNVKSSLSTRVRNDNSSGSSCEKIDGNQAQQAFVNAFLAEILRQDTQVIATSSMHSGNIVECAGMLEKTAGLESVGINRHGSSGSTAAKTIIPSSINTCSGVPFMMRSAPENHIFAVNRPSVSSTDTESLSGADVTTAEYVVHRLMQPQCLVPAVESPDVPVPTKDSMDSAGACSCMRSKRTITAVDDDYDDTADNTSTGSGTDSASDDPITGTGKRRRRRSAIARPIATGDYLEKSRKCLLPSKLNSSETVSNGRAERIPAATTTSISNLQQAIVEIMNNDAGEEVVQDNMSQLTSVADDDDDDDDDDNNNGKEVAKIASSMDTVFDSEWNDINLFDAALDMDVGQIFGSFAGT